MGEAVAKAERRTGAGATKLGLAALLAAAIALMPVSMILVPGMMPSIIVYCIDQRRPRYLSYAVGIMNFAGVLPFLLVLLAGDGLSLLAAARLLSDPFVWLVMYGAAAAGWGVFLTTPVLARICIEIRASQDRRTLEALSKALRDEWGEEVAGGAREEG